MSKTIESGHVKYVKSPGPKLDRHSYVKRSMIGNSDSYNKALDAR